jgi:hypothetical protein
VQQSPHRAVHNTTRTVDVPRELGIPPPRLATLIILRGTAIHQFRQGHHPVTAQGAECEQNFRLKRLLAEAELDQDALREVAEGKF